VGLGAIIVVFQYRDKTTAVRAQRFAIETERTAGPGSNTFPTRRR